MITNNIYNYEQILSLDQTVFGIFFFFFIYFVNLSFIQASFIIHFCSDFIVSLFFIPSCLNVFFFFFIFFKNSSSTSSSFIVLSSYSPFFTFHYFLFSFFSIFFVHNILSSSLHFTFPFLFFIYLIFFLFSSCFLNFTSSFSFLTFSFLRFVSSF